METNDRRGFDAPDLARWLASASNESLDAVEFGVVEMDLTGAVRRYNVVESRYSGLPPERVIGRHFFREVAPCCDNQRVARRYEQPALDETIAYTFALRMKLVPVTLRLVKHLDADVMYLLVRWSTA